MKGSCIAGIGTSSMTGRSVALSGPSIDCFDWTGGLLPAVRQASASLIIDRTLKYASGHLSWFSNEKTRSFANAAGRGQTAKHVVIHRARFWLT
jgi:hypothetical protein